MLRYTNGGQAVTTLGLAINSRRFNRTSQQWDAEPTTFLDATIWGPLAEHAVESLNVGDSVIVSGRLVTRTWTPEAGKNAGEEQRRPEDLQQGP